MKKIVSFLASLAIVVMTIPAMGATPMPVTRHGPPAHAGGQHFQNRVPGRPQQQHRFEQNRVVQ